MPTHTLSRTLGLAAALAALLCLLPALASAKSIPADVKVVDPTAKDPILAQHTQYTDSVSVATSPDADCFGEGTGGSGAEVDIPGPTALGAVEDATNWDTDVNPLSVTDAFSFGLGLCGFGESIAPSTGYWYLIVDHVASMVGGDQAALEKGSEVIWYLITDFSDPVPGELALRVKTAKKGGDQRAKVFEYDGSGKRSPAEGVSVSGADDLTDAKGNTTVDLGKAKKKPKYVEVTATRDGDIPDRVEVCVGKKCDNKAPSVIRDTAANDKIKGTSGPDNIATGKGKDKVIAKGGRDVIDVRGGGKDVVKCGKGKTKVKADKKDKLKGC